jgi:hypothetical protein
MAFEKLQLGKLFAVLFSRGIGYLVLTVILLVKKSQLGPGDFAAIGHDLVLAAFIVSPILAAVGQIQARRIAASLDIKGNILPVYLVSLIAFLCLLSGGFSELAFDNWPIGLRSLVLSIGFLLSHALVSWLVLWTLCFNIGNSFEFTRGV